MMIIREQDPRSKDARVDAVRVEGLLIHSLKDLPMELFGDE